MYAASRDVRMGLRIEDNAVGMGLMTVKLLRLRHSSRLSFNHLLLLLRQIPPRGRRYYK